MRKDTQVVVLLAAAAAFLVFIGAFLPWVKLAAPFVGQITKTGMEGGSDGLYTFLMALGALGLLVWHSFGSADKRPVFIALAILGGIIAIVAIIDINDVNSRADELSPEAREMATITIGEGLYLTLIGGIGLVLIGGYDILSGKQKRKPVDPTPP